MGGLIILLSISLGILLALGVCGIAIYFADDHDNAALGLVYSFFICIVFILILIQSQTPTAMDVYNGKTTLEITYKDGIPIDSTVVWKSK